MKRMGILCSCFVLAAVTIGAVANEIDRKCWETDCLSLLVENERVFALRTGKFSPGRQEIGDFASSGASLVQPGEAPIVYSRTSRGWTAVVSAYIPTDFLLWPELRIYIRNPQGQQTTKQNLYNSLGKPHPNFRMGRLFNTSSDFLQVSTDGEHSYVVRTLIWLLPKNSGNPVLLLDEPGLVDHLQQKSSGKQPGFWIDRETYDGVNAETKGQKKEFWAWNEDGKTLILMPGLKE